MENAASFPASRKRWSAGGVAERRTAEVGAESPLAQEFSSVCAAKFSAEWQCTQTFGVAFSAKLRIAESSRVRRKKFCAQNGAFRKNFVDFKSARVYFRKQ